MSMRNNDQDRILNEILSMPKYREIGLLESTVRDVVSIEFAHHRIPALAEKAIRRKIHNIVANYLGNPDYEISEKHLDEAIGSGDAANVKQVCETILSSHVSSRERLPAIEQVYQKIFSITGEPSSILDLACGLNPFTFPWMGLPHTTQYYAYDILRPRVELINHFFLLQGMQPLAENRDILIDPPVFQADIAFIWKEIHRFEQRRKDSSHQLYLSLKVNHLVVSLPAHSIHSQHDFSHSHRSLFYKTLRDQAWPVSEFILNQEMFFIIKKAEG